VDNGQPAEFLDGDDVRQQLWPELGFSRADREKSLNRISTVAGMLAKNGVLVLVSAIAPYSMARQFMRDRHVADDLDFVEVHVATPLGVCRQRDVKGLYARQARTEITGLTGVDATYEVPVAPELRIATSGETVPESADRVLEFLVDRGLFTARPASRPTDLPTTVPAGEPR
jgi:adenylylsulfate kinase